jgi:hypothetical protein
MGLLEIPFHDSAFSWTTNSGTDRERSVSFGTGSKSKIVATDGGESDRPALVPKLRSFAIMALVVGAGVAYNRLQRRRAREAVEAEESSGGWVSRLRSR